MTDIVERLRSLKWKVWCEMRGLIDDPTAYEAADTITTLRAENAALSAGYCDVPGGKVGDRRGNAYCTLQAENAALREALQMAADRITSLQMHPLQLPAIRAILDRP